LKQINQKFQICGGEPEHAALFHTQKVCVLASEVLAFSCIASLIGFITPYFTGGHKFFAAAAMISLLLCIWKTLVIARLMLIPCPCGRKAIRLFSLKTSKFDIMLRLSLLWPLFWILSLLMFFKSGFQPVGNEALIIVAIFFSALAPFTLLLLSGQAEKIEDNFSLVTKPRLDQTDLAGKSEKDLQLLLRLAQEMQEESNAAQISSLLSNE